MTEILCHLFCVIIVADDKDMTNNNAKPKLNIAIILSGTFLVMLNQQLLSPALPAVMAGMGVVPALFHRPHTMQRHTQHYSVPEFL